uniref:Uncharacterized protein n=1 Tax=Oryza brachyantha TaxID=4533 RepID=J3LXH1_ORYBR
MDVADGISQGLLSQLYHHDVEIDALVRLERCVMEACCSREEHDSKGFYRLAVPDGAKV